MLALGTGSLSGPLAARSGPTKKTKKIKLRKKERHPLVDRLQAGNGNTKRQLTHISNISEVLSHHLICCLTSLLYF